MENYTVNIPIPQDEINIPAALAGLINYVEKTLDVERGSGSPAEKEELSAAIQIALQRLKIPQVHRLTINDFELECLVGFGSFGQIWKAESEKFGPVALKQLKADLTGIRSLWNERDLMVLLKHKRICNLVAAFYDKDVYFVLELCHGSVAHLCCRISKENSVRFSVQLLQAVDWIHSQKVIHADIKPDNCLINTLNNLVLSDFGSAVYMGTTRTSIQFATPHGSPGYMDYRANKFLEFSAATDIFSTACVIFELSTKSTLLFYQDQKEQTRDLYIDAFEHGRITRSNSNESTEGLQREPLVERAMRSNFGYLLKKMIVEDKRLTAAAALEDGSLRGVLVDAKVIPETIDKTSKFVTREFTQDFSYTFDNFSGHASPELDLALLTFAYDENESRKLLSVEESSSEDEMEPIKRVTSKPKKKQKKNKKTGKKRRMESSSIDSSDDASSD